MREGIAELFMDDVHIDVRIRRFCERFPRDKKHRWVRDLAVELLHNADPERVPLMNRWVWDAKANTGVLRTEDVSRERIPNHQHGFRGGFPAVECGAKSDGMGFPKTNCR